MFDFAEHLEDINMISLLLPGREDDDEVSSNIELTRILFRAKAWKNEFHKNDYSCEPEV
jgi:hypothetical protein